MIILKFLTFYLKYNFLIYHIILVFQIIAYFQLFLVFYNWISENLQLLKSSVSPLKSII